MQEYKIVDKYFDLASFLVKRIETNQIIIPGSLLLVELLPSLKQYYILIRDYRDNFNEPTATKFPDHTPLIEPLEKLIAKSGAPMPPSLLPWIDHNTLSICFIKMRSLFEHLIKSIPSDYQDIRSLLSLKFDEFDKTFYKAFDDILKITTKYLKDSEIADFTLEFIPNPHKIHAELIMLEYRAKLLHPEKNPEEFIKLTPAIFAPQHLGVSKLSCVQCYFTFEFAGLTDYVRGGHGILFLQQWNFPQHWEMHNETHSLLQYLSERLIAAIQYYNEHGMHPSEHRGVAHHSTHFACVSDDEADAPEHKDMTTERYSEFSPRTLERFLDFVKEMQTAPTASSYDSADITSPSSESAEYRSNIGSPIEGPATDNIALAAVEATIAESQVLAGNVPHAADFLG